MSFKETFAFINNKIWKKYKTLIILVITPLLASIIPIIIKTKVKIVNFF